MNPLLLGPLVDLIGKISDKIWPDPAAKIAAQTELLKMQQAGELAILEKLGQSDSAQVEINKIEAASDDKFKGYWRPALGWAHHERSSMLERGPVDLVMALALIHHLAISNNVPLPVVADYDGDGRADPAVWYRANAQ